MQRTTRLFEVIQLLRTARKPMTAAQLAERLEVSTRTIYRDVAALQAMRTPIEGESGIGYIMRRGYDLPPLNFDQEELEALTVGLSMLARTGDGALQDAARRVCNKIETLRDGAPWISVVPFGAPQDDPSLGCVSKGMLRDAIREERKLRITYRNSAGVETERVIRPLVMIYHVECVILAAWCELRGGFRHFRSDRLWSCDALDARFTGQGKVLRSLWEDAEKSASPAQQIDEARQTDT
ncbi:helix-turn-helix transcriptional regulator [Marivita hallyeonensis]|uniref:Predicted DNA-binding transcriptional regulator YafY, contains an HTH and WYL domains n=1 Tax=Marivita hallyeonensis TaxID=996342 RepID=A0A1M5M9Y1_9RHOB|nr:YafY family protein [Marivita hallyeonensis]SHG73699.1 Predicted DNA-binding transcriptional regulator YafY, contains an HTH and WYL domains [Marivita hallyeonensis]